MSTNPLDWSKEQLGSAASSVALACLFGVFTIIYVAPSEAAVWCVLVLTFATEAGIGLVYVRRSRQGRKDPEPESLDLVVIEHSKPTSPWPFAVFILYAFVPFAIFSAAGGRIGQGLATGLIALGVTAFLGLVSRRQVQRLTISPEGVVEELFDGWRTMLLWDEIVDIREGANSVVLKDVKGTRKIAVPLQGHLGAKARAAIRAGAPWARVRSRPWY